MNYYFFQSEAPPPPQHILLDQFLPRQQSSTSRFGDAKTTEELAAIIANDILDSIKTTFVGIDTAHLIDNK